MNEIKIRYQFDYPGLVLVSFLFLFAVYLIISSTNYQMKDSLDYLMIFLAVFLGIFGLFFSSAAFRCYKGNFITLSAKKMFISSIFNSRFNREIELSEIVKIEIKSYESSQTMFVYLKNDRTVSIGSRALPHILVEDFKKLIDEKRIETT